MLKSALINYILWLTAPKEVTPANNTSVTDWQMIVRRDNVISVTLRQGIFILFKLSSRNYIVSLFKLFSEKLYYRTASFI